MPHADAVVPADRHAALYGAPERRPRPSEVDGRGLPLPPDAPHRALAARAATREALDQLRAGHPQLATRALEGAVHRGAHAAELLLAAVELAPAYPDLLGALPGEPA